MSILCNMKRFIVIYVAVLFASAWGIHITPVLAQDLVITANTALPEGVYQYDNLFVSNGAVLTVAGGSTVNVTGSITLTGNAAILAQGKDAEEQVNGQWQGGGVTISAASIQVDAGSKISADGQGYSGGDACNSGGAGPGGGVLNCSGGNGGSHGGKGSGPNAGTMTTYGSPFAPVDLGSGGSGSYSGVMGQPDSSGGAGGGAIRLIVSGTLTNDGIISANGSNATASYGGGGSGGSIYATVGTLAGSGVFTANGGNSHNGGGGGRIAVEYSAAGGYAGFNISTANGGTGAVNGTVVFVDTSDGGASLTVTNPFTLPEGTYLLSSISVSNGATLTIAGGSLIDVAGVVSVSGNSTILLQSKNTSSQVNGQWQGAGVTISAASIQVDAGSKISADGQGYSGGDACNSGGAGPGGGVLNCSGGNGGSHGGKGSGPNAGTMTTYGSPFAPVDLGSGGSGSYSGIMGQPDSSGGAGGGALRLIVSGTLTNDGIISANGSNATASYGGGGSGGSIYATVGTLAGSGVFTANGGNSNNGGSGGRIAVRYQADGGFTGFDGSTVNGGPGAEKGAAVFVDDSRNYPSLYVTSSFVIDPDTVATYDSLRVSNGSLLKVGGGSRLSILGNMTVEGNSTVLAQSRNASDQVNGQWLGVGVAISADTLQVDTGSKISADGQGYVGKDCSGGNGAGPGGGPYFCNNNGNGGSYGGKGGGPSSASMTIYGSPYTPTDLGSGGSGGHLSGFGGAGGGAIRLVISGTLTNNGTISANGAPVGGISGGGSGGSVFATVGTIAGSGVFTATGGASGESGGGGGRVALQYLTNSGYSAASISAVGGSASSSGSAGTVQFTSDAPQFAWLQPSRDILHGLVRLEGGGLNLNGETTTVDVIAVSAAGSQTLAVGLPILFGFDWDTTAVPDGRYELRLVFRNLDGSIIKELTRTVAVNNAALWHSGLVAVNETWSADRLHIVDGNVLIASGVTVNLQAGTVVKAVDGSRIIVSDGGLFSTVSANADARVVLTSLTDDTVGGDTTFDGGATLPLPGSWLGITTLGTGQFLSNGFTDLRYVRTYHSGTLSGSETWSGSHVHYLSGSVVVPAGMTLTIQPGAVVKFAPLTGIEVQPGGQLSASGSVAQQIYFTSAMDDSVGGDTNDDGNRSLPSLGDWLWIYLDGATASFDHVQMLYGGGSGTGSWNSSGPISSTGATALTFRNSVIRQSLYDGIVLQGGTTALIENSIITGSQRAIFANCPQTRVYGSTIVGNLIGLFDHGGGPVEIRNSIITHNSTYGIESGSATVTGSDIWGNGTNYNGLSDQTGLNGNISADPRFRNRIQGDFRLDFGSPAIDAAAGIYASATDLMGASRYDDPRTLNTGTGTPAYADMGPFEFIEGASSDLDLTVSSVVGPSTAIAGDAVTVNWTVTNSGTGYVTGPWHDAVYLVRNPDANPVELLAGEVLVGSGVVLGPGKSYAATTTVRVSGSTIGPHRWRVKTNVHGEIFEGINSGNNLATSLDMVEIDLREVAVNGAAQSGQFTVAGQAHWFKLLPGTGRTIATSLNLANSSGAVQLYVGQGYMPDPQHYDFRQQEWNAATATTQIPQTSSQVYYLAAYAGTLSNPENFTLSASSLTFSLASVTPSVVAPTGSATLELSGGLLTQSAIYRIVGAGGTRTATSVFVVSPSRVYATFSFTGLAVGSYAVQVAQGGDTVTLNDAIVVQAALPQGQIEYSLEVPTALRPGWTGTVTVHYRNTGTTDAVAPLIWVSADGGNLNHTPPICSTCSPALKLVYESIYNGYLLGINHDGPAGFLPPGAGGSLSLDLKPTISNGNVNFSLHTITSPDSPVNWADLKESLRPSYVPADAWEPIYTNFTDAAGSTIGEYNSLLANNATYLSQLGIYVSDSQSLFLFELIKAGLYDITPHYLQGAFGRGGFLAYNIKLISAGDNPTIHYADSSIRRFFPDPDNLNQYVGARGDYAVLRFNPDDQTWFLTEQSGIIQHFIPDQLSAETCVLDYIQDSNGNRLSITYQEGLVTGVTSSTGDITSYTYNGSGRIIQMTDSIGRITDFTYDISNEHLTSITTPKGVVSLTYVTGQGAAREHAIQSITYPDGVIQYFEYDERGRLSRRYLNDQSNSISFAYETTGEIIVTNATGAITKYMPDQYGAITRVVGPSGGIYSFYFDPEHRLERFTAPQGESFFYEYDTKGNLVQFRDAHGNLQSMKFGQYGRMLTHTNPVGESIGFVYDNRYNATSMTYPGGGSELFEYDARGNLVSWTNRRGNTFTYTYNNKDLLTRKTFPSGATIDYTYNEHRNPLTVTNEAGTTTFAYDAADRLTGIVYPGGRSIQYSYDATGRRTNMTDHTGFRINYLYDADGRLDRLNDVSNALITAYTYDLVGRLSRIDNGNGTYTTYTYDAAGRLLNLVNYAPNGATESRYDYTYDALGRQIALSAPEGNWAYVYDVMGQLTSVVRPDAVSMHYDYDAAGNREASRVNALSTLYTVNADGQYTAVGPTSYTYDADGNMTGKTEGGLSWTYAYDDENRLTAINSLAGSWSYEYDSLGNRIAEVHNGQRTEFLIDPSGMGNVLAEFTGAGALVAHYTHGISLVSRVPAAGNSAYYHYDASGNTVRMTGAAGAVLNRYAYLPFGEKVTNVETVANPFTFVGKYGVRDEKNGLYFMRHRWYDPATGHFVQSDPIGLNGNDANLYRYTENNPISYIDPIGLKKYNVQYYDENKGELINVTLDTEPIEISEEEFQAEAQKMREQMNQQLEDMGFIETASQFDSKWHSGSLINRGIHPEQKFIFRGKVMKGSEVNYYFEGMLFSRSHNINVGGQSIEPPGIFLMRGLGLVSAIYAWKGIMYFTVPSTNDLLAANAGLVGENPLVQQFMNGPNVTNASTSIVQSQDPNSKVTVGYGDSGYVTGATPLIYTVHFENVASATAAAQKVVVTDQLHTNLDWSTFELLQINFNKVTIDVPAGLQNFSTTSSVTTDPNPVAVEAALNPTTGVVTWTIKTIDPVTGAETHDPFAGFLPPNDAEHRGEGYVTFSVRPRSDLPDGSSITNQATIVFDANAPISTGTVINTIDRTDPTGATGNLPAINSSVSIAVGWGGNDAGSGVAFYDVYVSIDGSAYTLWLAGTTQTSAVYSGVYGHTYRFYCVATDNVGNRMAVPTTAQSSTTVPFFITASAGTGGSIQCTSPVLPGGTSTCTITPEAGYGVSSLTDNGVNVFNSLSGDRYIIQSIATNHIVVATFSQTTAIPVDGVCGSAHGRTLLIAPTANLCGDGSTPDVSGSGPWSWTCSGSNGGASASCSASFASVPAPVNGSCGATGGTSVTSKPTSSLCSDGSTPEVSGSGPWSWTCTGSNGGTSATCMAAQVRNYTVTPNVGTGALLLPSVPQTLSNGATQSFAVSTLQGYGIVSISGCGGALNGATYTTGAIVADCTVSVSATLRNGRSTGTEPSISDALRTLTIKDGTYVPMPEERVRYDVAPLDANGNPVGNGIIDLADVIIILRRVVGIGTW